MNPVLEGRHILVTGGGSGIGLACAARLRADRACVTLMGRSRNKLDGAQAHLSATPGPEVRIAAGDVASESDIEAAVATACRDGGKLDGCVAAAGRGTFGPTLDLTLEQWNEVMATNLTGAMLTLKHAGRAMVRAGGVDGLTGIAQPSVDNLPLGLHQALLETLRGLVGHLKTRRAPVVPARQEETA